MPHKPRNKERKDNPNRIRRSRPTDNNHDDNPNNIDASEPPSQPSIIPKIEHQFYNLDPDIQQYFKQVEETLKNSNFENTEGERMLRSISHELFF
jgi:hypothetical protein